MPPNSVPDKSIVQVKRRHPFQSAVLRGLAVILPPLLTIVILIWVWNAIEQYVLVPVHSGARNIIVWSIQDIHTEDPDAGSGVPSRFVQVGNEWVPKEIVTLVNYHDRSKDPKPETARLMYDRYVELRYLKPRFTIPLFLSLFIMILYLLGKFLAIRFGRIIVGLLEQLIHQLPIIRNVYSSVKQVTDFVFSEKEIEYHRVIAVEYPRRGIWSIGFVTGDSMLDIGSAANEAVLTVFLPSSPMPLTGYTITIRRSEAIDLDITVDQAIQFVVSCGVVVAPHQLRSPTNPRFLKHDPVSTNGSELSASRRDFAVESSSEEDLSQQ